MPQEAIELAGNLASFEDGVCHATINVDDLDPECSLPGLVINEPKEIGSVSYILNNSFGMLGINFGGHHQKDINNNEAGMSRLEKE